MNRPRTRVRLRPWEALGVVLLGAIIAVTLTALVALAVTA